jgi:hypothetical protein
MSSFGTENKRSSGSCCSNPNRILLQHADEIQQKSTEAVRRCQQQLMETEELGRQTIQEIHSQNTTMTRIQDSADMTNAKLDHTHKLLNRYDRWAFHWYGRNKRQAYKEGKQIKTEAKVLAKQQKETQFTIKTKKASVDKNDNHAFDRSQLLPSSDQSQQRTVNTTPIDTDTGGSVESPLDDETKQDLRRIEDQDIELDCMLDDMVESLNRISDISKTMNHDVQKGNQQMDRVIQKVDQVNHKQFVAHGRLRRNLKK